MMIRKSGLFALSCALLAVFAFPAQAVYINDNPSVGSYYMGSNDHGYGDIIGSPGDFAIEGMEVTRAGNILTVSIDTSFAGKGDDGLFSSVTSGLGIGYGDLFLASVWTPFGAAPYQGDSHSTGTKWLYGFSLDDRWMAPGAGSGTLYSLNGATNNDNTLLSEDFLTGATFRDGQEIAVDTGSGGVAAVAGSSSWSVNNSTVDFLIDLTGTTLAGSNSTFALHWGMTCGNDTIEGDALLPQSVVPVPAAIWLMGSGLLGLVSVARRRRKHG